MTWKRSPMLLSPATRSTIGVGEVEHGSVVEASVFAGSAAHVAAATITSRRPDGIVGNGDPEGGNGPNVVRLGHADTVRGPPVPSDVHVPSFHGGGSGWAAGQSFHQTPTVT